MNFAIYPTHLSTDWLHFLQQSSNVMFSAQFT